MKHPMMSRWALPCVQAVYHANVTLQLVTARAARMKLPLNAMGVAAALLCVAGCAASPGRVVLDRCNPYGALPCASPAER